MSNPTLALHSPCRRAGFAGEKSNLFSAGKKISTFDKCLIESDQHGKKRFDLEPEIVLAGYDLKSIDRYQL
jgi:hypothetical protein